MNRNMQQCNSLPQYLWHGIAPTVGSSMLNTHFEKDTKSLMNTGGRMSCTQHVASLVMNIVQLDMNTITCITDGSALISFHGRGSSRQSARRISRRVSKRSLGLRNQPVYTSRKESNASTCATSGQAQHQCRGLLTCIGSTTKTHRNLSRARKIPKPFHSSWAVCLLINT